MKTLILTHHDVATLLRPADAVDAVERAFALHGTGATRMPPKVYLPLPEFDGDFRAMPVFIPRLDVGGETRPAAGVKWINAHPRNTERHGLPSVIGVFILSDPRTAHPLAILDATLMTSLRTGAGAAVATKHLARARRGDARGDRLRRTSPQRDPLPCIASQIIAVAYELSLQPHRIVKFSGIGCSSKSPAYFLGRSHSINGLHGRMPSLATGALTVNRDLIGLGVSGDGDTGSIGLGQFKHMVRRNVPIVYIVGRTTACTV